MVVSGTLGSDSISSSDNRNISDLCPRDVLGSDEEARLSFKTHKVTMCYVDIISQVSIPKLVNQKLSLKSCHKRPVFTCILGSSTSGVQ